MKPESEEDKERQRDTGKQRDIKIERREDRETRKLKAWETGDLEIMRQKDWVKRF